MDVSGELATVGVAGASALVASMTVDGWHSCRQWIARWFDREGSGAEVRPLARLDRDRELLLAAPEDEAEERAREVQASWAVRLQDAADEDPHAARELLDFVSRWRAENPEAAQKATVIRQDAKAKGRARVNQVGGNQTIVDARPS